MMQDKSYYRLDEVAKEWECEVLDLFYYAKERGLKLSFIVRHVTAEVIMGNELRSGSGKIHGRETMANRIFDLPGRGAIEIEEKGKCLGLCLPVPHGSMGIVTGDGEFDASRIKDEYYCLGDHEVRLEDVVITKENLAQFPRPTPLSHGEYPPEMAVALECYQALYGEGVPDGLKNGDEKKKIMKWLDKHYSFIRARQQERIAIMVNPVSTRRTPPPERRKK